MNFGDYFDAGGDGNDLTTYLRTLNDGEVNFTVAAQYVEGGDNYFRVTLPADAQALLDNLATGDRWIFKLARPATAVTQTGSGEAGSVAAVGIEGTGRKLDAAARTGTGEAGTVAAIGIEGTGRSIAAVTRTGSGEVGSVVAEGIEGTGEAIVPSTDITQEFDLGNVAAFDDWFGSILIDPRLVAEGAAAYLRSVERIGSSLRFTISDTATGDASQAGPELIPEWEVYEQAILMQRDGVDALTLVGPDNTNNSFSDPAEPYFWTPASNSGFTTFWDDSEVLHEFPPNAPGTWRPGSSNWLRRVRGSRCCRYRRHGQET